MRALREKVRRSDDGFTIAEVMVALLIFAVMSTGSVFATISMLQVTRDARNRQVAANLAAQEIDAVRAIGDTTSIVNRAFDPPAQNGTSFHVDRSVSWTTIPVDEQDDQNCVLATQRYLATVTVTVTWEGMRSGTRPVTSDTLVTARDLHLTSATGIIMVTVLGADGTGRGGVRVQAGGASAVTNSQGCAFLLGLPAGDETVSIYKPGFVDEQQNERPAKLTSVTPGEVTPVQFQYDEGATLRLHFAYADDYNRLLDPSGTHPAWQLPAGLPVRTVASLPVTLGNPNGNIMLDLTASTAMIQSRVVHPFTSGYTVVAGSCKAADPQLWSPPGPASAPFNASPGVTTDVDVRMGVVVLTLPSGTAGELVAIPMKSTKVSGDPGCDNQPGLTYSFGSAESYVVNDKIAIALPYGSWKMTLNGGPINQNWMQPLGDPNYNTKQNLQGEGGGMVTFDPRGH
ncbi:MAG: prepilin-type N-terminal cleavage/methylation domain-containing protein [Micrococcales bacterium]|nr:prepilin-type N-terminal cleavage/methylation domain-containing protein [Micrococcales bacterium]MCL2666468.1 prepilin-type N-terminal cleavage/methylation domain-containing protein [Micrococcales bacterium]